MDVVASLPRAEHPGVRWTTRAQWHLTLRFLGEVDAPEPVARSLATAPLHRCTAVIGPRVATLGRSVLVVPVAGFDELRRRWRTPGGHGVPPEDRPFRSPSRGPGPTEASGDRWGRGGRRLVRGRRGAVGAEHLGPDGATPYEDLCVRRLD